MRSKVKDPFSGGPCSVGVSVWVLYNFELKSQLSRLSNGTLVITCPLNNLDLCGTNVNVTKDNIELSTFLEYEGATYIQLGRNRLSYGADGPGMGIILHGLITFFLSLIFFRNELHLSEKDQP